MGISECERTWCYPGRKYCILIQTPCCFRVVFSFLSSFVFSFIVVIQFRFFFCQEQRQKLNSLVWPALLERVKDEISKLFSAGQDVVFVEAAVLLQAGWSPHCHEVWVCLVPPEEVSEFRRTLRPSQKCSPSFSQLKKSLFLSSSYRL